MPGEDCAEFGCIIYLKAFFFFQFSLPAVGNSAVCFPPILQKESTLFKDE